MYASVCITTLNEEGSIGVLLDSLLNQTKKPDQIIIVDGGSTDKTVEIIRHYQQKDGRVKLLVENCSRARGRNLACEIAKGEIIAITDSGCVAQPDWLKNLTEVFSSSSLVEVAAGFYNMVATRVPSSAYKMTGDSAFQKAESFFLGTQPRHFDINFLPSTRSIAFRKSFWERVGGFPENMEGAAEDTVFNLKIVKNKAKIARVKSALVEWGMPASLKDFFRKIFNYAKGDAKSKIWIFPGKGLASHNIKALFILSRYLIAFSLLILNFKFNTLPYLIILFFIYLIWAFRKIYLEFGDYRVALWGPILQITSDLAVIKGLLSGIIG